MLLAGTERLAAITTLLQRMRLAAPTGVIWDAADVQWWWRRPRRSDDVPLPVWFDDDGPTAAALLTDWGDSWQADALVVPGSVELPVVWDAVMDAAAGVGAEVVDVLARDDDHDLLDLLRRDGFDRSGESGGTTWMDAAARPEVTAVPAGFRLVDRTERVGTPHPMRVRNGEHVEERLRSLSLYDPALDLAVETDDGRPAGYALYWHDPVTGVGQLEPMRVEDEFQRRGLARALLTEGLERLARKGAERLKVGFDGDAGRELYLGAGFVIGSTETGFRRGHPGS